ncbi:15860_t:CDS:2 [Cetraspora pellucida]|uniref:15860_t:CDS:1 n=1 Tax=Cetraspora pellucida TaxID=1433469 RepID=A0A9N9KBZ1_9GLOM|nr:15860_t:CDS:2 [Cetraspora pellucida]
MNTPTSVSDILNQILNSCCICQELIKKPVTVLECDHILHFNCAIEFFVISENITCPVKNCQNRIKNIETVEKDIDQAEELLAHSERNVVHAKKEVILSYYQFGKADAEKLKELLKISIPLRIAQSKIIAEVKKLLPSGTSINIIKRRIATARKIYDIFSTIGEDKIQRIRNFSASNFDVLQSNDPKGLNSGTNSLELNYTIDVLYMDDTEIILDK